MADLNDRRWVGCRRRLSGSYPRNPALNRTVDYRPILLGLSFVDLPDYRSIMTKRPTIAERVAGLVRRMDGTPLCDECIADRLDLSSIAQASVVTSSASGTGGFERLRGPCGLCGEPGPVIRYNG